MSILMGNRLDGRLLLNRHFRNETREEEGKKIGKIPISIWIVLVL